MRANTEADRIRLEDELRNVRASLSWRVTAPLRCVGAGIRMAGIVAATIQRQAVVRGSLPNALRHYATLLKREGLQGILARSRRLRDGGGFADAPPPNAAYHDWIDKFDRFGDAERLAADSALQSFERRPLISLVVPTYNSNPSHLEAMIRSVQEQVYPFWELCIADDASTNETTREILTRYQTQDARIRVVFRTENGHISAASNSALSLATGEFVALLDHDDILAPHALFVVAQYVNRFPHGRMFYSDEDKLDEHGQRTAPYFKCDWNPTLFRTQNLFSHLGVIETTLIRQAGGFRLGFEGSQDYDLALRCVEIAGNRSVVHIPHVLYHWRITVGSTAGTNHAKPYASIAAQQAIEDHLARCGIAATVERPFGELPVFRVRYAVPSPAPKVSIVIPTRDGVALLRQCVESIVRRTVYPNYEIIVVDNGSTDEATLIYLDEISLRPNVRIIRDTSPFNFSALNNTAVAAATGSFVCLLNNDTEVISPDWLDEMVGIASQPGVGAVGAALWYPNNSLQHGGVLLGLGGIAGHMHHMLKRGSFGYFNRAVSVQDMSAVTAACLLVSKRIYDEVRGLDESFAVAFNDVDFCLRVRAAGYRNVWTPFAELYHYESATRGSDMAADKYQRFAGEVHRMEERWGTALKCDPAYNPNLSLAVDVLPFTLAHPPRIGTLD
ncbi:TPA: glycosyltransferase family 2 protein [Burkholderia vietnamiensis]|nr:glycosyltransferase family 2 protein [Burkholderia vietnamiensis]HDR9000264.1 glycosyltransferase family 2 protein [Burkholderia vietnamiensis]HDR9031721.1 glycosyltransferase family 2 protein [Burkholderia vietnamiensis]